MTTRNNRLILALSLTAGLAGLAAVPATAATPGDTAVLGSQGEIYLAKTGPYGELFPGGTAVKDPSAPVLALDVVQPDGTTQRTLVPDTGGPEVEQSASLLYEEDSKTVFVVWESLANIHPLIRLASFDGSAWSPAVRVTGNPLAPKTSPQITITRDSYPEVVHGAPVTRHRTVLHLLWGEESSSGAYDTYYSPVILEDGVFIGWNPIYRLNDLVTTAGPLTSFETASVLVQAPALQKGSDGRTVVVAFASAATRGLATLEIDVLPRELVRLADETRSTIIDVGFKANTPPPVRNLAERARATILESGASFFHQEILNALANQVQTDILASNGQGITSIAEGTRSTIIDVGAKFSRRGLRPQRPAALTASTEASILEEISPDGPNSTTGEAHILHFQVATVRPAPRVGSAKVAMFLSENGENVLVAWQEAGKIVYKDSEENGWADSREIRLSPVMTAERAYEILQQRVQNR